MTVCFFERTICSIIQQNGHFYKSILPLPPMRVVGSIPHPEIKITIFQWNNRFLLKLEWGLFEQTYKIDEYEFNSDEEVKTILTPDFLEEALSRFQEMAKSLQKATSNL